MVRIGIVVCVMSIFALGVNGDDHANCPSAPPPLRHIPDQFHMVMTEVMQVDDYLTPEFLNDWHQSLQVIEEAGDYFVEFVNSQGFSFAGGKILRWKANRDEINFSVTFQSLNGQTFLGKDLLHVEGSLHAWGDDMIALTAEFSGIAVDLGIYPEQPIRALFVHSNGGTHSTMPCSGQWRCNCQDGPNNAWCSSANCDDNGTCQNGGNGGGGNCNWWWENGDPIGIFALLPVLLYRRKRCV